ncbi:HPt (histidine-containing phosphotransfer) domain-containing protein [Oxalobacteraceae bacterium GrIS 1.11]
MKPSTPSGHESCVATAQAEHHRLILDIEDGLDRIMDDRVLYFKLLRRFQHDHHATPGQIRLTLQHGQYGNARLKAHTLKGAAGMIGARTVYELASAVDAALRAQATDLELPLALLQVALDTLLSTIHNVLPDALEHHICAPDSAPDPDYPAARALLARLDGYLREGDGAAIDMLESSASALAACLGTTLYQEVAAAAHEFDFDGALQALSRSR